MLVMLYVLLLVSGHYWIQSYNPLKGFTKPSRIAVIFVYTAIKALP
jgi:hypothetical protein